MNVLVTTLDLTAAAGFLLVAWVTRSSWRTSGLAAATGVLWLLGDVVPALVLAHRGPLTHLLLGYPAGRLRSRFAVVVVAAVYVVSVFVSWDYVDMVTVTLAAAVWVAVGIESSWAAGARAAARPARTALVLVWAVLALASVARLTSHGHDVGALVLYELTVLGSVAFLLLDRLYLRGHSATVAALAAGLADAPTGSVRDVLAEALDDPTLRLDFTDPAPGAPPSGLTEERGQLLVRDGGRVLALVDHDPALLRDPQLRASVSTLVRTSLRNQTLQVEAADRIAQVEESRRRLVVVADEERANLEARLRSGVTDRIDHVIDLLRRSAQPEQLVAQARSCADSLRSFARGMHPRVIDEAGLEGALTELTNAFSAELVVTGRPEALPREVEVALYYVAAEALTNVAKYAAASRATVRLHVSSSVVVTIEDDGNGGATTSAGHGLGGLRDRLDVLGGRLTVDSPPSRGTRIEAVVPLPAPAPAPAPDAQEAVEVERAAAPTGLR